ncbi:Gfo/Idh/MocA family oxidoreductase, partial [Ruminococcaceae bacterium OttesenSCG-928-L11]|nr:Gfo/Idh/MocA family oxidoreductase [Ruminococcaceae bacterium OttesenSCG-928-L11]
MQPLRFIMVGAGGFGAYWIRTIFPRIAQWAQPVAVVDINGDALALPKERGTVPAEKLYTDIHKAIAETPCDFLVLVIPPEHRMPYIDLAVKHGLHVLCEKPIAPTMDDACQMYAKLAGAGLKASVTVSHRMEREKQSLNRLLDDKVYGKLNYITGRFTMRRQLREYPSGTSSWEEYVRAAMSGGVIHELDTFRGLARSNAKTVFSRMWRFDPGSHGAGLSSMTTVEMENGVTCFIEHSSANATELNGWSREYYRAECESATVVLDGTTLTASSGLGFPLPLRADLPLADDDCWDHTLIVRDFCAWLNGGPEPETTMKDHLHCCALTFAAVESAVTGKAVDVQAYLKESLAKHQIAL